MDAEAAAAPRVESRLSRLVGRPVFWLALVTLIAAVPAVRAVVAARNLPPPPPVLGDVPRFALTDQFGRAFDSEQLRGKVWVADFIFTRCPTVCPKLTAKMSELQGRSRQLGDAFALVSFTVDPEFDTAEVLKAYGEKNQINPRRWTLLTGGREDLQKAVVDGLKIYMAKEGPAGDLMSYAHGSHFVVVDAKMQIRGFYDSNDPEAVNQILRDVGTILNRGE